MRLFAGKNRRTHRFIFIGAALACVLLPPASVLAAPVHYTLDSARSSVHFDAKTTTHDFSGDTGTLSGEMDWDPEGSPDRPAGVVRIPVAPIKTGVAPRDRSLRRMFEEKIYPRIEFRVPASEQKSEAASAAAPNPSAAEQPNHPALPQGYDEWLEGALKIRAVELPVSIPVVKRQMPDGSLEVEGDVQVSVEKYQLKPPALMGLIRVLPDIKIHFKSVWKPAAQK